MLRKDTEDLVRAEDSAAVIAWLVCGLALPPNGMWRRTRECTGQSTGRRSVASSDGSKMESQRCTGCSNEGRSIVGQLTESSSVEIDLLLQYVLASGLLTASKLALEE